MANKKKNKMMMNKNNKTIPEEGSLLVSAAAENPCLETFRDALPTHFTFKIESFSQLATSSIDKYESKQFEAGGYKWRLLFYPKGNDAENGGDHISMYLEMVETSSLPPGWVADAFFRFFVLDQVDDKYLILGDMGGKTRRFYEMKRIWGNAQLMPLAMLNDSSNGYLVSDTCVFGVEVFVCKSNGVGESLTMVKSPSPVTYMWKIENFSKIKEDSLYSPEFTAGDHKWRILLYPKGDSRVNKDWVSLYLTLGNAQTATTSQKLFAYFTIMVKSQLGDNHRQFTAQSWFTSGGYGSPKLMKLSELNDLEKGFLFNDTCTIEAEVTVEGVVKSLP